MTIGKVRSPLRGIGIGVPQGSVLGPLLFLIYINDIHDVRMTGKATLFADDTALLYLGKSTNENVESMNEDVTLLKEYFDCNKLLLNVRKTECMHFRKKNLLDIGDVVMDGMTIEAVAVLRYLGLFLDEDLMLNVHILKMCGKIASVSGVLCKLKWILPKSVLMKIYYSLVHSNLSYLPGAWGTANLGAIRQLQVLQKRCLKHINKLPLRFPTRELFRDYCPGVLNVDSVIKFGVCTFLYDEFHGLAHGNIRFARPIHRYDTRNRREIRPSFVKSALGTRAITSYGTSLFNSLPREVREAQRSKFRLGLKRWLIENQYP